MELADYLALLRKRWLAVVVLTAFGAFASLAYSLVQTPMYSAQSQVFVSVQGADTTGDMLQGANFVIRAVRSYTQLVSSPRVLQPVIEELGLTVSPDALASRVHAESPLDTVLINVSVEDPSPLRAAEISNATATSLARVVNDLETPAIGGPSPVQIQTVRPATVPRAPSSPNLPLNLALGTLVGLALGVGLAVLRESLDTKVRTPGDIAAVTDAPVLGIIAFDDQAKDLPLLVQSSPNSLRAEAFRRLRTNLQFLEFAGKRALVITSALPGEGKSTTSINLGITLAQAGQRVVLVDADLRRPAVAAYLGIEQAVGLTTLLIGRAKIDDVIQPWGNGNLDVITSGRTPPNPSELLGSERMAEVIEELTARYDVVLIDSSPLLPVTDGAILARLVGGAVVVVGAGTVDKAQVSGALAALAAVDARLLGVVVTRVPLAGAGSYGYNYYEYASLTEPSSRFARFGRKRAATAKPAITAGASGEPTVAAGVSDPTVADRKPIAVGKAAGKAARLTPPPPPPPGDAAVPVWPRREPVPAPPPAPTGRRNKAARRTRT